MNKNLVNLLKILLNNQKILEEFKSYDSIEELYEFCISIVDGYTFSEFENFLNTIASTISEYELSDNDLTNVAGGTKLSNKTAAAFLSSLLFAGSGGIVAQGLQNDNNYPSYNDNTTTNQNENQNCEENFEKVTTAAKKITNSNNNSLNNNQNQNNDNHTIANNNQNIHSKSNHQNNNNLVSEVSILKTPSASSIQYGQSLSESKLFGGQANVAGSFSWVDGSVIPNAGVRTFRIKFTPNNSYFQPKIINVNVTVMQATPQVYSWPTASDLTYGQKLSESKLSGGTANMPGTFDWDSYYKNQIPDAGSRNYTLVFTPKDSINYKSISYRLATVKVHKAIPRLNNTYFETTYEPNLYLHEFSLPHGWSWDNAWYRIDTTGILAFNATYSGDKNHERVSQSLTIKVNKAEPTVSLPRIIYHENRRLRDIPLPRGWHWDHPDEIPTTFKSKYKASFNAYEAGTNLYYTRYGIDVPMKVLKADPGVHSWPSPKGKIIYGSSLENIVLKGGYSAAKGIFKLHGSTYDYGAGEHMCKIVFTPTDPNYQEVTHKIPITILKNMIPEESPLQLTKNNAKISDYSISFKIKHGVDPIEFSKDGGKTWQDSPNFADLTPETEYRFAQRYKDTKSRCAGIISDILTIRTKKRGPEAPDRPKLISYTNHKIVVEKTNKNLEYSIDDGTTWQDSPELENLSGSTKYKIIARIKETEDRAAGKSSLSLEVKTRSWAGNLWNKVKTWFRGK